MDILTWTFFVDSCQSAQHKTKQTKTLGSRIDVQTPRRQGSVYSSPNLQTMT